MTGSTKQSRHRHSGMVRRTRPGISRFRVRCFASPRNDGVWIASSLRASQLRRSCFKRTFATSRRDAPEAFHEISRPLKGVGNAGCPWHPRPRVHLLVVESTRVTTSTPESPGVPARNGFNGFLRALLGDRALLPPSPHGYPAHPNPVGRLHLRKT